MKKIILIELPLLLFAFLFNALSSFLDIKPIEVFVITSIMPLITFIYGVFCEIYANKRKNNLKNLEKLNKLYLQIIKYSNENYAKNQARLKHGLMFHEHINIDHPLDYFEKELFDGYANQIKASIYIISGKRKGKRSYISINHNLGKFQNYICEQIKKIKPSEEEFRFYSLK